MISTCILHLDYSNSLLAGLPQVTLQKVQIIENFAAKTVLFKSKHSRASETLKELHWLPIRSHTDFKMVCPIHKCLHGSALVYLHNLIARVPIRRSLHSNQDITRLIIPRTKSKPFAPRAFSVYGLTTWNELPTEIREVDSHEQFKKLLKTYYFRKAFT